MDESSMKLVPVVPRGLVVARGAERRALLRTGPGLDLNERRSAVSLVAFACDDPDVQPQLPQVFLSNRKMLTKDQVLQISSQCPTNVFVVQRASAWLNAKVLVEIIQLLAQSLNGAADRRHIILSMDACRVHLTPAVAQACTKAGIFLMIIPASMTPWLQPLDLAIFKKYKNWVSREYERHRLSSPSGRLNRVDAVGIMCRGVAAVLESSNWRRVFERAGLCGQGHLSETLLRRLQCTAPPVISSDMLSLEQLMAIYPKNMCIPVADVFELALARDAARRQPWRLQVPRLQRLGPPVERPPRPRLASRALQSSWREGTC